MKFFQVLVTDKYETSINKRYTQVYNYSSLAEAFRTIKMYEYQGVTDGETFTDECTNEELCQFHMTYEENGAAVIELRHEYFGVPKGCTTKQVTYIRAIYIKEITL